MLQLIKRCPEYTLEYKEYCRELHDNHVIYFRPANPNSIDEIGSPEQNFGMTKKKKG